MDLFILCQYSLISDLFTFSLIHMQVDNEIECILLTSLIIPTLHLEE